jgi:raffinose/stachyose/melibiose transport system permease protein
MFEPLSGPAVDDYWLVVENDVVRNFFGTVIVTVGAVVPAVVIVLMAA